VYITIIAIKMAADEPRLSKAEMALISKYKQLRKQQVHERTNASVAAVLL
jgi:hypothetical protein